METRTRSGDKRLSKRKTRFTMFSGSLIAIIQKYVMNSENGGILRNFLNDTEQVGNSLSSLQ